MASQADTIVLFLDIVVLIIWCIRAQVKNIKFIKKMKKIYSNLESIIRFIYNFAK